LELLKAIRLSEADVKGIRQHPAIRFFRWFAEDVPDRVWQPVVDAISLPAVPILSPDQWFIHHGRRKEK
jgi:hypothetical protein